MDLISIIVPIYNVEKYLDKCIKSIVVQTYYNIEIILINDGSTDGSLNICKKWKNKDKRITLLDCQHNGVSEARNIGIKKATGKYISFVDSDDYIDKRFIEKMYNKLTTAKCEIVQCGFEKINNEGKVLERSRYKKNEIKPKNEVLKEIDSVHHVENVVLWNKLYLASLFKDLEFPFGRINEDEFITYKLFYKCSNIAIINEYLYYYRYNIKSIMGRKYCIKRLDCLDACREKIKFFKEMKEEDLYIHSINLLLFELRQCYYNINKNLPERKGLLEQLTVEYRKMFKQIKKKENNI